MRDNHILNILESKPLRSLSKTELATVQAHLGHCDSCLRAYRAAEISSVLLKETAAVEFGPSPFFSTRVLARIREHQKTNEGWVFSRLWRATGALVSTMLATVAALAVFTFLIPSPEQQQGTASVSGLYPAEEVLALGNLPESELTNAQVFTALYGFDDDLEESNGNSR